MMTSALLLLPRSSVVRLERLDRLRDVLGIAGAKISSPRSGFVICAVCSTPRGTNTNDPGLAITSRPGKMNVNSPSPT